MAQNLNSLRYLKENKFSLLSFEEKLEIKKLGPTQPVIGTIYRGRKFNSALYKNVTTLHSAAAINKICRRILKTQKNLEKNFFAKFFDEKINENLQKKWLTFGCRRSTKSKHHKKTLSSKQKKELKIFHIEPEVQKFQHFIPLHKLWKQYMKTLVQFGNVNVNNLAAVHLKVLKADYHGCYLTVSKSKCPSYVGTSGIVIMESKNIFKIITKDDKLKRVPKKNSIFSFSLEGYCFTLYGNHMKVKSSERSHRKFKNKPTIDL